MTNCNVPIASFVYKNILQEYNILGPIYDAIAHRSATKDK